LPVPLLMQQLIGPLLAYVLMRQAITAEVDVERTCSVFTSTFLRAVGNHPYNEVEGG
jgi:hypothetical protein